jgi:hypothetical protein
MEYDFLHQFGGLKILSERMQFIADPPTLDIVQMDSYVRPGSLCSSLLVLTLALPGVRARWLAIRTVLRLHPRGVPLHALVMRICIRRPIPAA